MSHEGEGIVTKAQELDGVTQPELGDLGLDVRPERAVSTQPQPNVHLSSDRSESSQQQVGPLLLAQTAAKEHGGDTVSGVLWRLGRQAVEPGEVGGVGEGQAAAGGPGIELLEGPLNARGVDHTGRGQGVDGARPPLLMPWLADPWRHPDPCHPRRLAALTRERRSGEAVGRDDVRQHHIPGLNAEHTPESEHCPRQIPQATVAQSVSRHVRRPRIGRLVGHQAEGGGEAFTVEGGDQVRGEPLRAAHREGVGDHQ